MCSTQTMVIPELAPDAAEHLGGPAHLGVVQPAQALVGEEEPRPGGERARQLELLEATRAEKGGHRVGVSGQADQAQDLRGLDARLRFAWCAIPRRNVRLPPRSRGW